ncbi:uncharacterized protein LOC120411596 [Corvus cornix cornix]|uniref:uncharacterized protein LOC120411596 n=1 Tax=Corvus cornix cornix TaxID=932674 RepID=UPI00194EC711|nr:uncharacterized protein LOC120411596 [Corvus cornix cornix]
MPSCFQPLHLMVSARSLALNLGDAQVMPERLGPRPGPPQQLGVVRRTAARWRHSTAAHGRARAPARPGWHRHGRARAPGVPASGSPWTRSGSRGAGIGIAMDALGLPRCRHRDRHGRARAPGVPRSGSAWAGAALLLTWSGLLPWISRACHPGSEAKEDQTPLLALAAIKLYTSIRLCSPSHLSRGRANAGGDGGAEKPPPPFPRRVCAALSARGGRGGGVLHGSSRPALASGELRAGREPCRRDQPLPSPAVRRWGHPAGGTWGGGRRTRRVTGPRRG